MQIVNVQYSNITNIWFQDIWRIVKGFAEGMSCLSVYSVEQVKAYSENALSGNVLKLYFCWHIQHSPAQLTTS